MKLLLECSRLNVKSRRLDIVVHATCYILLIIQNAKEDATFVMLKLAKKKVNFVINQHTYTNM